MTALSKNDLKYLISQETPLIEDCPDIETQLQVNGIDLTLREIASLQSAGKIAVANSERVVSGLLPLDFDEQGFITLVPGSYLITFNEVVHLPNNIMALGRPRSSLLRCGVTVGTAVWDAGYSGRSQALLMVHNPGGFNLQRDARVIQLVFFKMTGETDGYNGVYQGENL